MTACAGAQAKTVQVGSPLTGSFPPVSFGPASPFGSEGAPDFTLTLTQARLSEPGANVSSPVDGTVISYRVAAADGTFAIQVIRPLQLFEGSFGSVVSVASSTPTHITSSGVSSPITTKLAIKGGHYVGIRNFGGASDQIGWRDISPTTSFSIRHPPLADGGPPQDPTGRLDGEIGMQATVRYCKVPKLKGKSLKGARKALTAADCRVGKLKKTNEVRDKKQVVSQSVNPGKAVSDTKPINLGLSRKQG